LSLDVTRQVLHANIIEPFLCKMTQEYTYCNNRTSSFQSIIIIKDKDQVFGNLAFSDFKKNRLEINARIPRDDFHIEVILPELFKPKFQKTITMTYDEPYRGEEKPKGKIASFKQKIRSLRLFREPEYSFRIELGEYRTYFYITPPPKLRLEFLKKSSLKELEEDSDYEIHDEPEPDGHNQARKRNALFIRFPDIIPKVTTQILEDMGFSAQIPPRHRIPKLTKDGEIVSPDRTNKLIQEARQKAFQSPLLYTNVDVRINLSPNLKKWFYFVFAIGFLSLLFSPSIYVTGAIVALLITTRSWLFYEEDIMKGAGFWFLILLLFNVLNMGIFALGLVFPHLKYGFFGLLLRYIFNIDLSAI